MCPQFVSRFGSLEMPRIARESPVELMPSLPPTLHQRRGLFGGRWRVAEASRSDADDASRRRAAAEQQVRRSCTDGAVWFVGSAGSAAQGLALRWTRAKSAMGGQQFCPRSPNCVDRLVLFLQAPAVIHLTAC
jgi:hypothetical protein